MEKMIDIVKRYAQIMGQGWEVEQMHKLQLIADDAMDGVTVAEDTCVYHLWQKKQETAAQGYFYLLEAYDARNDDGSRTNIESIYFESEIRILPLLIEITKTVLKRRLMAVSQHPPADFALSEDEERSVWQIMPKLYKLI